MDRHRGRQDVPGFPGAAWLPWENREPLTERKARRQAERKRRLPPRCAPHRPFIR